MPWTGNSFRDKHNHGITTAVASKAAKQANAILKKTGDEGLAIAVANRDAKKSSATSRYRHKGYAEGGKVTQTEDDRDKALLDYKSLLMSRRKSGPSRRPIEPESEEIKMADGGTITEVAGEPIGKEDGLIAAQKGEYVIKKSSADKLGENVLDAVNKGDLEKATRLYNKKAGR